MARYMAGIQGSRGEVTRLGGANSGIQAYAQGWNAGVRVDGGPDSSSIDSDSFAIRMTGGSNGHVSSRYLGTVMEGDKGPTWHPADEDERKALADELRKELEADQIFPKFPNLDLSRRILHYLESQS